MENPLDLWSTLPTPMKWLVGAALAGIGVFAYIKYKSSGTTASSSISPDGTVSGTSMTAADLLKGLGYDGSTTAASATGTNTIGASNGASSVAGLLGSGLIDTTVSNANSTSGTTQTAGQTASGNSSIPSAQAPAVSNTAPKPPQASRYITVQPWYKGSTGDTTLGNIASNEHVAGGLTGLLNLNPSYKSHPDVVQAGAKIRVA